MQIILYKIIPWFQEYSPEKFSLSHVNKVTNLDLQSLQHQEGKILLASFDGDNDCLWVKGRSLIMICDSDM